MTLPDINIEKKNGRYYASFVPDQLGHTVEVAGDTIDEATENAWTYLEDIDADQRAHDALVREAIGHLEKARHYINIELDRLSTSLKGLN